MSAEAALIGKPVISITPINFYVENYLIRMGLIKKIRNSETLNKYIKKIFSDDNDDYKVKNKKKSSYINKVSYKDNIIKRSQRIVAKMDDPIEIFKKFL
jgi:predicted glycosyltransferase